MKRFSLALILAAATIAASAQTSSKPSTSTTPGSTASKKTTAASSKTPSAASTTSAAAKAPEPWIKLPDGVPAQKHGLTKTVPIIVHYQDLEIGKGAEGESGKLWHLQYKGYRAEDSAKPDTSWIMFDSWEWHKRPKMDKDGKPELDADKKPIMGEPEPAQFPQGVGGTIPGFDFGLAGMKIGGSRRIFIPWQLGYGTRDLAARKSPAPGMPDFPGIPPKSDLIFDVTLVDVTDMPQRPQMPMPQVRPAPPTHPGAGAPPNGAPSGTAPAQPAPPAPQSKPATPPPPSDPTKPTTPAPSTPPAQPQSK